MSFLSNLRVSISLSNKNKHRESATRETQLKGVEMEICCSKYVTHISVVFACGVVKRSNLPVM